MEALLVVDVEDDYGWGPDESRYGLIQSRVAANIKNALARFRSEGKQVIFVVYPFYSGYGFRDRVQLEKSRMPVNDWRRWFGQLSSWAQTDFEKPSTCFVCETPHPLAPFLDHHHDPFEPVFFKNDPDAFENPALAAYLREQEVISISLAGCSTTCCVRHTATGALKNGFNVKLLRGCVHYPFKDTADEQKWLQFTAEGVYNYEQSKVSLEIV